MRRVATPAGRHRKDTRSPFEVRGETRQKLSEEAIAHATAIKVDAMVLMGGFLRSTEKATGGDAQRTRFQTGTESPPTLSDLGIVTSNGWRFFATIVCFFDCQRSRNTIFTFRSFGFLDTKKESSQAQALAAVKENEPELFAI